MKYNTSITLATLALAATSVQAVANAEPEPWCMFRGQSCWKVKRAAEAFSDALHSSNHAVDARSADASSITSNTVGGASFLAKRQVDQLASIVALSQSDPVFYYESLNLGDTFPADVHPNITSTGAEATHEKRDEGSVKADKRWCMFRGQSCWKAKRAAEALLDVIGPRAELDPLTTPFNPVARVKREAEPWCMFRGQSCWKRDASPEAACNAPDGACTKATRDLHAMQNVARAIIDAHPE